MTWKMRWNLGLYTARRCGVHTLIKGGIGSMQSEEFGVTVEDLARPVHPLNPNLNHAWSKQSELPFVLDP